MPVIYCLITLNSYLLHAVCCLLPFLRVLSSVILCRFYVDCFMLSVRCCLLKLQSANIAWLLYMHGKHGLLSFVRRGLRAQNSETFFWEIKEKDPTNWLVKYKIDFEAPLENTFSDLSVDFRIRIETCSISIYFVFCHLRRKTKTVLFQSLGEIHRVRIPTYLYHSQSPTRECLVSKNRLKQVKNKNIVRL